MRSVVMVAIGATALAACSPSVEDTTDNSAAQAEWEAANDAATQSGFEREAALARTISREEAGRACRGAIAGIMGRDPSIISVISQTDDLTRVRYTRDDGTVWTQECEVTPGSDVTSGQVLWRQVENGQPGRWRNEDGIRYELLDGDRMRVVTTMVGEPMSDDTFEVSR